MVGLLRRSEVGVESVESTCEDREYKAMVAGAMRSILDNHRLTSPDRMKEEDRMDAKRKKRKARAAPDGEGPKKTWRVGMFAEITDGSDDEDDAPKATKVKPLPSVRNKAPAFEPECSLASGSRRRLHARLAR